MPFVVLSYFVWRNLISIFKLFSSSFFFQYKDAFFSANPNFKWYKLPAPPLRSISMQTRPDRQDSFSDPSYDDYDTMSPMSKILHGPIDMDCGNNAQHKTNENANKSSVGLFKLADETQMGGLNSLMMAVEMVNAKSPSSKTSASRNELRVKVEDNIEQGKHHFHCSHCYLKNVVYCFLIFFVFFFFLLFLVR